MSFNNYYKNIKNYNETTTMYAIKFSTIQLIDNRCFRYSETTIRPWNPTENVCIGIHRRAQQKDISCGEQCPSGPERFEGVYFDVSLGLNATIMAPDRT